VVIALVAMLIDRGTAATALFAASDNASHTLSTAALASPSNPALGAGLCVVAVGDAINVSWTKTSSTWADGYEVLAGVVPGGPYTISKTVAGVDTQTTNLTGLSFLTTYYVVVKASKANWRSAATAEVSRTTRSPLCT
jgi:hypothetical protein